MQGESNHTRNQEQEYRQQFQVCTENSTATGFFFVFTGKYALHNELVGTPVPETDNGRTNQCTQPWEIGIIVIADKLGHGVSILIDCNCTAYAHHFIPTTQFFKTEDEDDKRTQKKDRGLQYRGIKYGFHSAEYCVKCCQYN